VLVIFHILNSLQNFVLIFKAMDSNEKEDLVEYYKCIFEMSYFYHNENFFLIK